MSGKFITEEDHSTLIFDGVSPLVIDYDSRNWLPTATARNLQFNPSTNLCMPSNDNHNLTSSAPPSGTEQSTSQSKVPPSIIEPIYESAHYIDAVQFVSDLPSVVESSINSSSSLPQPTKSGRAVIGKFTSTKYQD